MNVSALYQCPKLPATTFDELILDTQAVSVMSNLHWTQLHHLRQLAQDGYVFYLLLLYLLSLLFLLLMIKSWWLMLNSWMGVTSSRSVMPGGWNILVLPFKIGLRTENCIFI